MSNQRDDLARRMAGDVVLSDDPGATLRKWRTDFDVPQTALAEQLDISPSVISDYESGRRESPGISVVRRIIDGLLDIDAEKGGEHVRRYARVLSAGFESDVVYDLREYPTAVPIEQCYDAIEATEIVSGKRNTIVGHTVLNSIEVITRLSSQEFYRLFGQSTNRALIFTDITRGESPLVALRVVIPTPTAVILHGLTQDDLWEHAPALAKLDGYSLATTQLELNELLERLRNVN